MFAQRITFDQAITSNYTGLMPAFFVDVLATSLCVPPPICHLMGRDEGRHGSGARGTQSSQALAVIAQNIDLAADEESAICRGANVPTFEVKVPVGANQIAADRDAVAEATQAMCCDPTPWTRSPARTRQQPRSGHDHSFRAVGQRRRDRGEVDPQGWRLREHERAVLAAAGAAESRPRRSLDRACASASCTRYGTRKGKVLPGALGVCIGGDRTSGYVHAKNSSFGHSMT